MIDFLTRQRIKVSTDSDVVPYILAPIDQLPDLRKLLDDSDIRYSIDDDAIRLDGEGATAVINLRSEDSQAVQEILDDAAVMVSIAFVDGSLQEYFESESLVTQLASFIEEGYTGKALIDELLTDDWGAGSSPAGNVVDRSPKSPTARCLSG